MHDVDGTLRLHVNCGNPITSNAFLAVATTGTNVLMAALSTSEKITHYAYRNRVNSGR